MNDWAEDERRITLELLDKAGHWGRTYCSDCEIWLLLLYKIPRRAFGKRLASSIAVGRVLDRFFFRDWVPILLCVNMTRPCSL